RGTGLAPAVPVTGVLVWPLARGRELPLSRTELGCRGRSGLFHEKRESGMARRGVTDGDGPVPVVGGDPAAVRAEDDARVELRGVPGRRTRDGERLFT